MGEANFIPGEVADLSGDHISIDTALGSIVLPCAGFTAGEPRKKEAVTLCIRPEHFRPVAGEQGPTVSLGEARVTGGAFFGTHYRCHLQPAAGPALVAHLPQSASLREGQSLALAVKPDDVVILP
ncbi:MAG: TOBE domain-containing protein [Labrys sp. (in: a-proteobacteria)]